MTTQIRPERVEITPAAGGGFTVSPFWAGVDRPSVSSYDAGTKALAERLQRALLDGAAYEDAEIRTDVNGRTYVGSSSLVMARRMSADLRRLGY